jgi:dipeptidyl aminopeptidase/acylaminoacyl peptidase
MGTMPRLFRVCYLLALSAVLLSACDEAAEEPSPVVLSPNLARDGKPSWSPDGTKIVFWSERDGDQEIYSMNADGSNPTRLTNSPGDDVAPDWGREPEEKR